MDFRSGFSKFQNQILHFSVLICLIFLWFGIHHSNIFQAHQIAPIIVFFGLLSIYLFFLIRQEVKFYQTFEEQVKQEQTSPEPALGESLKSFKSYSIQVALFNSVGYLITTYIVYSLWFSRLNVWATLLHPISIFLALVILLRSIKLLRNKKFLKNKYIASGLLLMLLSIWLFVIVLTERYIAESTRTATEILLHNAAFYLGSYLILGFIFIFFGELLKSLSIALVHLNLNIKRICRLSERCEKIKRELRFANFSFSTLTLGANIVAVPLYFYFIMQNTTALWVALFMSIYCLPYITRVVHLLKHIEREYFFIFVKLCLIQTCLTILVCSVSFVLIYYALHILGKQLVATPTGLGAGLSPDFFLYFVSQELSKQFLLSYSEGLIYSALICVITIWLYAIILHKEKYRFTWCIVTLVTFLATLYYDNELSPEDFNNFTHWTITPTVVLFTIIPIAVQFLLQLFIGPYHIKTRCPSCAYKSARVDPICPCCGLRMHIPWSELKTLEQQSNGLEKNQMQGFRVGMSIVGLAKRRKRLKIKEGLDEK